MLKLATIILFMSLLSACVTAPPAPEEMVPQTSGQSFNKTNKSIKVSPVTGGGVVETIMGHSQIIDNASFHQTLVNTLRKSNMFGSVSPAVDGDYSLSTEIIAQRMNVGVTNVMTLLVRYKFVETAGNRVLWQENIFSQHIMSVSEVFMGNERMRLTLQGGVQKNLSQLLEKLNRYITEPPGGGYKANIVAPEKNLVESVKPKPVSPYPRKLAGNEIDAHFQRYRKLTFDRVPRVDFTIKIRTKGYVERLCPECRMDHGFGSMRFKVSQAMVCFDWDLVSYPSGTCFELIQVDENRFQLVDPVDGETYGYVVND